MLVLMTQRVVNPIVKNRLPVSVQQQTFVVCCMIMVFLTTVIYIKEADILIVIDKIYMQENSHQPVTRLV